MSSVNDELEAVRASNPNGELVPEEVVDFASNPNTALHSRFEWDDSKAGHLFRLQQARSVIRVHVAVVDNSGSGDVVTTKFVSLSDHRGGTAGYQPRVTVLSDEEKRRRHALDVITSVIGILSRADLPELDGVLNAALSVQTDIARQIAA